MGKMQYLALLRGINVGGNNIIKMGELRKLFAEMGFADVLTYIQSGNVVFKCSEKNKLKLKAQIEKILLKKFGNKITLAILTLAEMQKVIADKPSGFGENKKAYKYDVVFLLEPLKAPDALKEFNPRDGVDKISAGKNVIYVSRLIKQITKSRFTKIIGTKIYQNMTIRNWNTTEKLYKLMKGNNKNKNGQYSS
ncbi:protein DUF1697 [Candidatus Termititenax persephonae]|uniref:Protein DUF1697 n=1 Tax=Candidatus Termititenax persephonae TaxID=2218525 RepID=A0A388TH31_9BACT|nr:protein DUF1697 [Candidatus Termititenax persephonae]